MSFGGETFDEDQDGPRLSRQLKDVRAFMADHAWRTLRAIALHVGASEASVSARLRDLRKPRFGSYVVERRRVPDGEGLHIYRVLPPEDPGQLELIRQGEP